jgi:hypothetical protein
MPYVPKEINSMTTTCFLHGPDGGAFDLTVQRDGYGKLVRAEVPPVAFREDTEQFYAVSSTPKVQARQIDAAGITPEMLGWYLTRSKPNTEADAHATLERAFGEVAEGDRHAAARTYSIAAGITLVREPTVSRDLTVGATTPRSTNDQPRTA